MKFFKGLFSITENKVSTIATTFIVTLCFVIYVFLTTHTVDGNMTNIIITFIVTIAGTNGVNVISDVITVKNQLAQVENSGSTTITTTKETAQENNTQNLQ